MLRGTIKKVVRDRGFGFILSANKGPDVFFHVSTVEGRGFDSLEEGQTVDYDLLDEGGNGKGVGEGLGRGSRYNWINLLYTFSPIG